MTICMKRDGFNFCKPLGGEKEDSGDKAQVCASEVTQFNGAEYQGFNIEHVYKNMAYV